MSSFEFQPLLSFNARCQWQLHERPITAGQWEEDSDMFRPFWVEFDDWNGDDGWLITSWDYGEEMIQSFLLEGMFGKDARKRYVSDCFWFGVYRHADGYVYEIRPAYEGRNAHAWPELDYWLDTSRNGYLGFYSAGSPAGVIVDEPARVQINDPIGTSFEPPIDPPIQLTTPLYTLTSAQRTPLWHIPGLNPATLRDNDVLPNLMLYSPKGRQVRRQVENVAYLNDQIGKRGGFTLIVSQSGVPPHSNPQP